MKIWKAIFLVAVVVVTALPSTAQAATRPVLMLEIDGVINPFSARYLERGLQIAEERNAQVAIITLDTPGGLESAMRDIMQMLLDSPVPTVVYVTPRGARATSAGMFVLLAADVAAMSPATHVGAAHPVPLGADVSDVMDEKMVSDAAALVRSVAEDRGRNADWAERAVRENLSLTASEALELNVIDLIAQNLDDLLVQLDGREVAGETLLTSEAPLESARMNLAERFLHIITEPNIAYLLLSLGTLMALAELADPGLIVPGVGAAVAFALAFVGLGSLPVNWAGLGLLALSVVIFLVGLLTDTEPVVTFVGLVPFILGSLLLFAPFSPTSPAMPVVEVSLWLIGIMAVSIVGFSFLVLQAILKAGRQPPRAGAERLVGHTGTALTDLNPAGEVYVDLQNWSAVAVGREIPAGEPVLVTGVAGVRLKVAPAEAHPEDSSETNKEI